MEWLNLHASFLDSPAFIGSDPTDRATWLCLLRYCIGQENSGVISDAGAWSDRKWQQLVRVTMREAKRDCALWKWDGDTITVAGYPVEKERMVKEKRETARRNGIRGGRPPETNIETKEKPTSEPILVISEKAEGEGEGEGKEKVISVFGGVGEAETYEAIYAAYPRKIGKQAALKAIARAASRISGRPDLGETPAMEWLRVRTLAYAGAVAKWPAGDERFIPHPATWFNRGSYDDDPATWVRVANQTASTRRASFA